METEFLSKWIDACCQIKNNETNSSSSSSSSRGTKISTTTIQVTEVPWNLPIHLVFLLTHTIHCASPVVYFHSIFFSLGFCFCSNKFSAIEPFLSFLLSHPSHSVLLYFYLKANFYFKSHKRHSSAAAQVIYAQHFFLVGFFLSTSCCSFVYSIIIFIIYLLCDHIFRLICFVGCVLGLHCSAIFRFRWHYRCELVYGLETVRGRKFEHWWKKRREGKKTTQNKNGDLPEWEHFILHKWKCMKNIIECHFLFYENTCRLC